MDQRRTKVALASPGLTFPTFDRKRFVVGSPNHIRAAGCYCHFAKPWRGRDDGPPRRAPDLALEG